jgi:hypothetical protein
MDGETEAIYMHTVTKGGEFHTMDLGVHKGFNDTLYLTHAMENGGLIKVDDGTWLSLDCVASVRFSRFEVH